jgi:hypothetical protein
MSAGNLSMGRVAFMGFCLYGCSSYISFRYNNYVKSQTDLKEIKDKKKYLLQVHNQSAETYDKDIFSFEYWNKIKKFRRTLLTHARGKVCEFGFGPGTNLEYYPADIEELIGVDWAENMLE